MMNKALKSVNNKDIVNKKERVYGKIIKRFECFIM